MPIFDPDGKCPLLNKKCIKHQCIWYNMLQGTHPQTGQDVQEWGCSIAWLPLLLVENSKATVGVKAATESFRNEMVPSNNVMQKVLSSNKGAKKAMENTASIFELLGNYQKAKEEDNPGWGNETIRQLSNNKIKIKEGKKGKKNVNNDK